MSKLTPFQFDSFSVRVITTDDGETLFVASDIAIALGYSNPSKAVQDHCKRAKLLKNINYNDSLESLKFKDLRSDTKIIPESDVYRLIMRSKLESADTFQDWLVEEVIPSIRKTGSYTGEMQLPSPINPIRLSQTSKAMISMAKAFGFKGNQAYLSADRATERLEGHSPLKLLGVDLTSEVKERTLTPTDIGIQLGGVSAQGVNKILEQEGFQTKIQDGHGNTLWNPTEKGLPFGEFIDTHKKHGEGSPVKQWKWFMSIVSQIKSDSNDTRNGLVLLQGDKV